MLEVNDIVEIESLDMTQLSIMICEKKEELFDIKYSCHLDKCITKEDKKKIDQLTDFINHCYERLRYLEYWLNITMMEEKDLPF